jgi:hypothetical protein
MRSSAAPIRAVRHGGDAAMSELLVGLGRLRLPEFTLVEQHFAASPAIDIPAAVRAQLARPEIAKRLRAGATAALAVGSRGIRDLRPLVTSLVAELRARGLTVIIVPAMGSHGGATAAGQAEVLARLGIDERTVGAEVRSAMDTCEVAHLSYDQAGDRYLPCPPGPGTLPVHVDARALAAELVIPVARVKPHTGFRGRYESGICKMLSIGLGKHEGCSLFHREGYQRLAALIPAAAAAVLALGKIAFAMAVVEDAHDRTAHLEAVAAEQVLEREPELLALARRLMPRLLLPRIDVLVVEEFGKDISGVGMDPNITGRSEGGRLAGFDGADIGRIVVLALTAATHGNATGLGMADVISERVLGAIDRQVTATNVLTSGSLAGGRTPLAMASDELAILAASCCVPGVRPEDVGMVRIRNTLQLSRIAVSRSLLEAVARHPGCAVLGPFTGEWDAPGLH